MARSATTFVKGEKSRKQGRPKGSPNKLTRPLVRPIVRPLTRRVTEPGFGAWSPRVLFAASEQGAWYDPSDLSTLFQDAAGTTPVTALGQPVGLMLDKRFGLARGPELVTNGDFSAGAAGWVAGGGAALSIENGALRVSSDGNGFSWAYHACSTQIGKTYEVRGVCLGGTATAGKLRVTDDGSVELARHVYSGAGAVTLRAVFVATSTSSHVQLFTDPGDAYLDFDNISVRELPGNHASQPTATARPVLAAGNRIDYDGVDDNLTTTFPDLGSNVTIARSVPGSGASILTGQTIGAGAWDDSTDSHALVIIDRGLTAAETTNLTRWLNRRAGL